MRKTGLAILGDVPWGRHVALFYETKADLLKTCVPFFKAGLESNEVCAWVIAEPLIERDAWGTLREAVPALDRYRADRRIEILRSHRVSAMTTEAGPTHSQLVVTVVSVETYSEVRPVGDLQKFSSTSARA
jgi:hypothetical protein